jgi:hypothetical protein
VSERFCNLLPPPPPPPPPPRKIRLLDSITTCTLRALITLTVALSNLCTRYTLVGCGGLDVNVDSNTRQRDFCATDAFITGVGQLALSSDYGMPYVHARPSIATSLRALSQS